MEKPFRTIEKKITSLTAAFMIECGGVADALPVQPDTLENLREQYGEAYTRFEKAVDNTSDDELRAVGIAADFSHKRTVIKKTLPMLWVGHGNENVQEGFPSYVRVNYGIVSSGAKIFYSRDSRNYMDDYSDDEFKRDTEKMGEVLARETGILVRSAPDRESANCALELYHTDRLKHGAIASLAPSSFATWGGDISLPFHRLDIVQLGLKVEPPSAIRHNKYYIYDDLSRGLRKFIRSHSVVETSAHEFGHILGLGHSHDPNDIMWGKLQYEVTPLETKDQIRHQENSYIDKDTGDIFEIKYPWTGIMSNSMILVRWLRAKALSGQLKDLLLFAQDHPVPHRK